MSNRNGRGVSLTPRKLNLIVRSYLYRKKLADTLESLQFALLSAIQELPDGVVFASGYSISSDPKTGEINLPLDESYFTPKQDQMSPFAPDLSPLIKQLTMISFIRTNPVLPHPSEQRRPADAELSRRLRFAVAARLQRLDNSPPLDRSPALRNLVGQ